MTEETERMAQRTAHSTELPPPGPVYVISETGFGPTGRFESEEEVDKQAKQWRLLTWFSKRIRIDEQTQ